MKFNSGISIIVPMYNVEKTIEDCIKTIIEESKSFKYEIIVVDDNSTDNSTEVIKKFESIKLIKLNKNQGAGNARNIGARNAIHEILCFVDADIIISKNSIVNLVEKLQQDETFGSVGGIQEVYNLNKNSWSSNFVCLKSCFGFENVENQVETSDLQSEFFVIYKFFFEQIGGFRALRNAGGEEFFLGYEIIKLNKKNIKLKYASYRGLWCSLYGRFKKVVDRTEKYLHLFLIKKKFDSPGSFATSNQSLSTLITLIYLILIFSFLIFNKWLVINAIFILFILQIAVEYKFLIFGKMHFGIKMVFFSLFGIQIINIGILIGVMYFFLNSINIFSKNIKKV